MLLIEGMDLRVTAELTDATDLLVVTFTGRDHNPPAPSGAGEPFFRKHNVSTVHFISKANHWWQTPEFAPALDLVRHFATRNNFRQLATYGSSMGGYGAMAASGRLKADRTVAFVPQFSVNPAKVPWERRWLRDQNQLDYCNEDFATQAGPGPIFIFSDPYFVPDQKHVDAVRALRPVIQMRVPFAEHDGSRVLAEMNLLSSATLAALRGTIDKKTFAHQMRTARKDSPLLWGGASRLVRAKGKPRMADRLGAKAFELMMKMAPTAKRPEHSRLVLGRVANLLELDKPKEALSVLDRWATLNGGESWPEQRHRGAVLAKLGDGAAALAVSIKALRGNRHEKATLNQVALQAQNFAGPDQVAELFAEFHKDFLKADSAALRMVRVLRAKGLARESALLAAETQARYPKLAADLKVQETSA